MGQGLSSLVLASVGVTLLSGFLIVDGIKVIVKWPGKGDSFTKKTLKRGVGAEFILCGLALELLLLYGLMVLCVVPLVMYGMLSLLFLYNFLFFRGKS